MAGRNEHFADGAAEKYRNATPAKPEDFGVQHVPHYEAPLEVIAHHEMLGPQNDKHGELWSHTPVMTVHPHMTVKTTQDYLGREHVENYGRRLQAGAKTPVDFKEKGAEEDWQDNGRPRLIRQGGELWHMDGLHRIAAARSKGRAFKARVWDADAQAHKPDFGAAPGPRHSIIDHLVYDHPHDNAFVHSDTPMHDEEIHDYHADLHAGGVADHRHA